MAFQAGSPETVPTHQSPEAAALYERRAVVQEAFGIAMGATVRYEPYVEASTSAPAEGVVVNAADRFINVGLGGMVQQPGRQEQMAA